MTNPTSNERVIPDASITLTPTEVRALGTVLLYLREDFHDKHPAACAGMLLQAYKRAFDCETPAPQAPIAKITVKEGPAHYAPDDVYVSLYAPGLPPGEHDVYLDSTAPGIRQVETTPRHLQPSYVLEQIMNNSTDRWAQGVARTCLMGSSVEPTARCAATGCKSAAMENSGHCKEHYDLLGEPSDCLPQKASAVRDTIAPNIHCPVCDKWFWDDKFDGHKCLPLNGFGEQT